MGGLVERWGHRKCPLTNSMTCNTAGKVAGKVPGVKPHDPQGMAVPPAILELPAGAASSIIAVLSCCGPHA